MADHDLQPAGLRESSRRSERGEDLRYRVDENLHSKGVPEISSLLAPFQGADDSFPPRSGGLTTTGYSLAALQAAPRLPYRQLPEICGATYRTDFSSASAASFSIGSRPITSFAVFGSSTTSK